MTKVKEQAMQMIRSLPDEKVIYIVKIIEGLEGLGDVPQTNDKKKVLAGLQKFRGRLPENFDYKKELAESREERYENLG